MNYDDERAERIYSTVWKIIFIILAVGIFSYGMFNLIFSEKT